MTAKQPKKAADATTGGQKGTPKKRAFLAAYARLGNVSHAARQAQCARSKVYKWLADDANFSKAFDDAREAAADRLEMEARRRAVRGTFRPVFYKGVQCGSVREYSDTLLIFLLKGARPEKYRENIKAEHTGEFGNVNVNGIAIQTRADFYGQSGELPTIEERRKRVAALAERLGLPPRSEPRLRGATGTTEPS